MPFKFIDIPFVRFGDPIDPSKATTSETTCPYEIVWH